MRITGEIFNLEIHFRYSWKATLPDENICKLNSCVKTGDNRIYDMKSSADCL